METKVLTSFTEEDQKEALETRWKGNVPLDPEEVETQEIIDMGIHWKVDCDDMSFNTTGSSFIVVEDDFCIGSFLSKCRKLSFNNVPDFFAYEKKTNSNRHE